MPAMRKPPLVVPVVRMSAVLSSVPSRIDIWLLKTDMQGYDAKALTDGGPLLRRVHYVAAEVVAASEPCRSHPPE